MMLKRHSPNLVEPASSKSRAILHPCPPSGNRFNLSCWAMHATPYAERKSSKKEKHTKQRRVPRPSQNTFNAVAKEYYGRSLTIKSFPAKEESHFSCNCSKTCRGGRKCEFGPAQGTHKAQSCLGEVGLNFGELPACQLNSHLFDGQTITWVSIGRARWENACRC